MAAPLADRGINDQLVELRPLVLTKTNLLSFFWDTVYLLLSKKVCHVMAEGCFKLLSSQ